MCVPFEFFIFLAFFMLVSKTQVKKCEKNTGKIQKREKIFYIALCIWSKRELVAFFHAVHTRPFAHFSLDIPTVIVYDWIAKG